MTEWNDCLDEIHLEPVRVEEKDTSKEVEEEEEEESEGTSIRHPSFPDPDSPSGTRRLAILARKTYEWNGRLEGIRDDRVYQPLM